MHVQRRAHAVARAVAVVRAGAPEKLPRQRVYSRAGDTAWEQCARQGDVALEHQREVALFFHRRGGKVQCAGDVGRAVSAESLNEISRFF